MEGAHPIPPGLYVLRIFWEREKNQEDGRRSYWLQATQDCVDDTKWASSKTSLYVSWRSCVIGSGSIMIRHMAVYWRFGKGSNKPIYLCLMILMCFSWNLLELRKLSFLVLQRLYTNIPTIFQQGVFGSEIIMLRKLSNLPFVGLSCYSWQTFSANQDVILEVWMCFPLPTAPLDFPVSQQTLKFQAKKWFLSASSQT